MEKTSKFHDVFYIISFLHIQQVSGEKEIDSSWYPVRTQTLFQRLYNVHNVEIMSNER